MRVINIYTNATFTVCLHQHSASKSF